MDPDPRRQERHDPALIAVPERLHLQKLTFLMSWHNGVTIVTAEERCSQRVCHADVFVANMPILYVGFAS